MAGLGHSDVRPINDPINKPTTMRPSLWRPLLAVRPPTTRRFTTAYAGEPGDGRLGLDKLDYIPLSTRLKDDTMVEVAPFEAHDVPVGRRLMNEIIVEGRSWPFEEEFETDEAFSGYFLSHTALVVRSSEQDLLGMFYVKPNFPGRCSHVCNGGFITAPAARGRGVARLMGNVFLQVAHDLGYESSYFNLVFRSNVASVQLWQSLGFERVAVLERAARLRGLDDLDTAYGYRYDLTKLTNDYLFQNVQRL